MNIFKNNYEKNKSFFFSNKIKEFDSSKVYLLLLLYYHQVLTSKYTHTERERETKTEKMNELASNIEHKNPNTKKNEAVEEEKNEESHALVDFIYNSFFFLLTKEKERKKNQKKKPQMK